MEVSTTIHDVIQSLISPACFNTATGDVEDAPAPDPLNRFDVFEKDGAVYVKGQESDIKNGRRQPNVKCSSTGNERVVIVGGYSALPLSVCTKADTNFTVDPVASALSRNFARTASRATLLS
jgi:hypothetical protein